MKNAKPMPPIETLNAKFDLDAARGVLIGKQSVGRRKAGHVVGTPLKEGHLMTGICGKRYLVHRVIYYMATGVDPMDRIVDHINGNPADNRPENLRLITSAQNTQSRHNNRSDNASGTSNVSWDSHWQRWKVSIGKDGKRVQRKFVNKDDAIACARQLRAEILGEFAGTVL
jgi:hypothetical protein